MFKFDSLQILHQDMIKKDEARALFPFSYNGKNFSCIFLIDITPVSYTHLQLKINNKEIDFPKQCFGDLDQDVLDDVRDKLCTELNLKTVSLDNVFYIFDNMDLLNPEDSIRGKLIKSFVDIKGEEPQNPNALYRLVVDSVKEKASYEFDSDTYEDVVKNKGITRSEFDKMLNAHKKESKNGLKETQEYINNLSFAKRRRYNTALGNILETQQSESLRLIRIKIYNYIIEYCDNNKETFDVI